MPRPRPASACVPSATSHSPPKVTLSKSLMSNAKTLRLLTSTSSLLPSERERASSRAGVKAPKWKLMDCCAAAGVAAEIRAKASTVSVRRMAAPQAVPALKGRPTHGQSRRSASRAAENGPETAMQAADCPLPRSGRPLEATALEVADHRQHGVMENGIGGQDTAGARRERRAGHVGDAATGLLDNQCAARDVPRLEVAFPEAVHASGRDIAEIDRRRAQSPYGARPADERREEADDLV